MDTFEVPGPGPSPLQKSLVRRGLFGLALQLMLRLRGLVLIPILVRALPPAEVGVLNLGNAFTGWITPLLLLGLNSGFALRVVHLSGTAVRPAILTVLAFSTAVSTLGTLMILMAVDRGLLGTSLSPLVPVLLPLGLLAIGTTLREVTSVYPQIRQQLRFVGRNSILMDFGGVVAAITLVLMGFGAFGALLGPAILNLLGAAIAASYSMRFAEGPFALDHAFLGRALRSAVPVVPLAMALWALQSSDYFFVSHFRGTSALAVYGLAYTLASPTLMVLAAMNMTYLPTCVEILGRGRSEFARFIDSSTRLFALAGVAAVAFSVVAGPGFISWFAGSEYTESGRLLPVVVAAYVVFSLGQLQQFVPGAMTQNLSGSARAYVWAAMFNIACNFMVVPRFGYWGAAWTTLASYGLAFFLMTRGVRILLPEITWPGRLPRVAALALLSSGIAVLVRPMATSVVAALSLGSLVLIAVVLLALALQLTSRDDLGLLKHLRTPDPGRPAA